MKRLFAIPLLTVLTFLSIGQANVKSVDEHPIEETPEFTVEEQVETTVTEEIREIPLGICKLTAYCCENYHHICNNGDASTTATGTSPTPGRTVAVDPSVIPYGSEVIINGYTYIAEDCGGAIKGNQIDIVFATHEEALRFGVQYAEVYVKIKDSQTVNI